MKKSLILYAVALLTSAQVYCQSIVTGLVKGSQGEPLIGVNIYVKSTIAGTITGIDGKFSLTIPQTL